MSRASDGRLGECGASGYGRAPRIDGWPSACRAIARPARLRPDQGFFLQPGLGYIFSQVFPIRVRQYLPGDEIRIRQTRRVFRLSRLSRFALPVSGLFVIVVGCVAAFVGLGAAGLWVDELYTAYFSDPHTSGLRAALLRAAEDTNPPVYYLGLRSVRQVIDLDYTLVSRGVSAILAILALFLVVLVPARGVGAGSRGVAAAFAASSPLWIYMSQEARSYALMFVLVAAVLGLALRCQERLRLGSTPFALLTALGATATLACLTHYYGVLVSGAVFAMLLAFCGGWTARAAVAVTGLAVLGIDIGYMSWHLPHIVLDPSDTWFSDRPAFLLDHAWRGLADLLADRRSLLFVALSLCLLAVGALRRGLRGSWQVMTRDGTGAALLLLAGVFMIAPILAITVTVLYTPIFSFRFFSVLAPVAWVGMAYVTQLGWSLSGEGKPREWIAVALALAVLASTTAVFERGRDDKQAWRQSASFVARQPGCLSVVLPVVWRDHPTISTDDPERFYGFYLPPDPGRTWLKVPPGKVPETVQGPGMRDVVRQVLTGGRTCNILLWSVHIHGASDPEEIVKALELLLPAGTRHHVEVVRIMPPDNPASSKEARVYLLR